MARDIAEKTVLIVEDNDLNLKLARELITLFKYKGLEADNAEKGLELARLHRPDLILMDIELPGIDGFMATRIIRNDPELKKIPVLALSAYAMDNDKAKAKQAGFTGYITKPIDIKSFKRTIKMHLEDNNHTPEESRTVCGRRILIVDDDALNIKLLAAQLSSKGYSVITASDGETALEKVEKDHPDLILLDLMMPGMDGYEVTARLKADPLTRYIPIILITALKGVEDKKKGLRMGADEFINKPINFPELEARVMSLLKLSEYREQLGTRMESQNLIFKNPKEERDNGGNNQRPPTVLIVDDDSTGVKLMTEFLSNMGCNIERAKNGEEAIRITSHQKIDVMLLDIMLPGVDGFEICRAIKGKEETSPIQVVMITGLADTRSKVQGIEAGTDDFLVKPVNREEFRARIKSLIKKKAYLDQLLSRVDTALYAAITDKLTGVYNHGYFKHFLQLELKRSQRYRHNLALLMIDVDGFKEFNDRYGHQCGDQSLGMIARILRENVREIDLVARYGGEEFAVSLPYADIDNAKRIAERLVKSVADHGEISSAPNARLSVSVGISLFPDFADSPEGLIRTADVALYNAKRGGKNRFCLYGSQDNQAGKDNNIHPRSI